jgi:sulfur transfer protein SufE|tara:strand:- start:1184 stop:1555 length:372 start_codon:yes stop_codon:yes gene_type:complete
MSELLEQLQSVAHDQEMFYDILLEIGGDMEDVTDIRKHENYVSGCQSAVWITAEKIDGVWDIKTDSDAFMVKGVAKLVAEVAKPDPSAIRFGDFHSITKNLTVQRQKGMQAIINTIIQLTKGK